MYYTYILRCGDNTLYSGITTNPINRLKLHKCGKGAKYTRTHGVKDYEALWISVNRITASKLEYRLKQLTKQEKEKLIICHNLEDFSSLQKTENFSPKDFTYLGGVGYADKMKKASIYCRKDVVLNIDISEALEIGKARIAFVSDRAILVYLPNSLAYFVSADTIEDMRALKEYMTEEWYFVVVHQEFGREVVLEWEAKGDSPCYNVAYLKKEFPPHNNICEIKKLDRNFLDIIRQNYALYDAVEEITDNIDNGRMYGAFIGKTLVGFAGFHNEGAMGMLVVFEEYKGRGVAGDITYQMIKELFENKRIPFAQIFIDNTSSIRAQQKLGFEFSSPYVCWCGKLTYEDRIKEQKGETASVID